MPDSAQPPTTSIAVTSVPSSPPAQPPRYDNWDVVNMGLAAIVGVTMFFGAVLGIWGEITKRLKSRRTEEHELLSPLESRIKSLEETAKNFRSIDQLDRDFSRMADRIEHEKVNRTQAQDQLHTMHRNLASEVNGIQRQQTRMETQFESLQTNTARVETAVEQLRSRIEDRFDKLTTMLTDKS